MDKIVMEGGHRLSGKVPLSGAKNAALPILAATLLCPEACTLLNVPHLRDIETLCRLLENLGAAVTRGRHRLRVEARTLTNHVAPYELVRTMRASVLVLG